MRPPSIFAQVLSLSTLILLAALGVGAALTLVLPAPDRGRMNIREMAWALELKPSSVIDVRTTSAPPEGLRTPLVERALAHALARPQSEIRAVWKDRPGAAEGAGQNVLLIDGRDVLVSSAADGFTLTYGDAARLDPDTFVPLFAAAVRTPDGRWRTGIPRDPVRAAWRTRMLLAFLGVALALTAPVWWISHRIARPIEALAAAADGALLASPQPFALSGPREVRKAAGAINAMHARLAAQARDQLRMVVALAHDLRTPLTALRLRAEEAPPDLLVRMTPDLHRMSRMIEDCLALVSFGVRPLALQSVRLDTLLGICCEDRPGVTLQLVDAAPVTIESEPVRLRRALDNLIDNAVRYAEATQVTLTSGGGFAMVTVADRGPGIPEAEIERLLRPFETMDPARSAELGGVGLGLSIVAEIAREIGAAFVLRNSREGLTAQLTLPLSIEASPRG